MLAAVPMAAIDRHSAMHAGPGCKKRVQRDTVPSSICHTMRLATPPSGCPWFAQVTYQQDQPELQ
jgi:hypothetical protein